MIESPIKVLFFLQKVLFFSSKSAFFCFFVENCCARTADLCTSEEPHVDTALYCCQFRPKPLTEQINWQSAAMEGDEVDITGAHLGAAAEMLPQGSDKTTEALDSTLEKLPPRYTRVRLAAKTFFFTQLMQKSLVFYFMVQLFRMLIPVLLLVLQMEKLDHTRNIYLGDDIRVWLHNLLGTIGAGLVGAFLCCLHDALSETQRSSTLLCHECLSFLLLTSEPALFVFQILCIQIKCFHEIINIGYVVYRSHDLPWFRTLSWFFMITSNYFFYGESMIQYFGVLLSRTVSIDLHYAEMFLRSSAPYPKSDRALFASVCGVR